MQHSDVEPDILVLSKALSAGLVPVGAVLTTRSIYNGVFDSLDNCVVHSSTFGQGAYAMAAGLATLHVFEEEGIVENSRRMGALLLDGLKELAGRFELISEVRGRGLMIGGAQMSEKHCNFMINTGEASSSDLEALGEEVRRRVQEEFNLSLRWEIKRIGLNLDIQ